LRIPQLKDCKNHFDNMREKGKGTVVFNCEGQSAAGSITDCRRRQPVDRSLVFRRGDSYWL